MGIGVDRSDGCATAPGKSRKGKTVKDSDHANVEVSVKTASTSGAKFTG